MTHPNLHSWRSDEPLHLVVQTQTKEDTDPKAFACYGIDLRWQDEKTVWLRFVEGNPKSAPTIRFLAWMLAWTAEKGIRVLVMVWNHASWHKSKMVQKWICEHNQRVKRSGEGARLLAVLLPKKSPWVNPIEPRWIHVKRKVTEPTRRLSAHELAARVWSVFQHPVLPWLPNDQNPP